MFVLRTGVRVMTPLTGGQVTQGLTGGQVTPVLTQVCSKWTGQESLAQDDPEMWSLVQQEKQRQVSDRSLNIVINMMTLIKISVVSDKTGHANKIQIIPN